MREQIKGKGHEISRAYLGGHAGATAEKAQPSLFGGRRKRNGRPLTKPVLQERAK